MPAYNAWFECIETTCNERFPLTEVIYRCPRCDKLLKVEHEIEALKHRSGAAWMRVFDDRYMRTNFPYGSGVWGKKEWVYPHIDDESIVSTYEGGSNLFMADRFGELIGLDDLWIKQLSLIHI